MMKGINSHSYTPLAPRLALTSSSKFPYSSPNSPLEVTSTDSHFLPGSRKPAWEPHKLHQHLVDFVQPFRKKRRRNNRDPPKCIPPLDLSQFNQPDELMEPIEIIPDIHSVQSQISWGQIPEQAIGRGTPIPLSSHHIVESVQEASSWGHVGEVQSHSKASNDREKTCEQENEPLSFGFVVPQVSLHKSLKFEACVATQNGRDVHRQLCGFYFLLDGSISVYECRQFGKKTNALPLIQRGIYQHCTGLNKGKTYEINYIKKGMILQFNCRDHPSLPLSLTTRYLLSIRVIDVDEKLKNRLMSEGLNPIQCHRINLYLSSPIVFMNEKEERLLHTLQGMFCSRLSGRASKTLVALGQHLRENTKDNIVSFLQLLQSLRKFHISLTAEDMQQFWYLLHKHGLFFEDFQGIHLDFCLFALTGHFSIDRAICVRQVFKRLDCSKSGHFEVKQMKKYFINAVTEHHALWSDMLTVFKWKSDDSVITYPDFENFHLGVSVEMSSDSKFVCLMRNCWGI